MIREQMMKRAMKQVDIRNHPVPNALANIVATEESRQRAAADRLLRAAGVAEDFGRLDVEDRRETLLGLADAVASDNVEKWWFEEVMADRLDAPEDAVDYAGISLDEWSAQIERWADGWRDAAPDAVDGMTDAQIADFHVERKFGVRLDEFALNVVGFSKGSVIESVLATNIRASTRAMNAAAAALEESE